MSGKPRNWDDLTPRILTALVLGVVGIGAIWSGGNLLLSLAGIAVAFMVWELARMLAPDQPVTALSLAVLSAVCVFGFFQTSPWFGGIFLIALPVIGWFVMNRNRRIFSAYGMAIILTGVGLVLLRGQHGLIWILWLISVVIVTDVAGYFVGRYMGGPKFWPRISPKKTWSGTVAGWLGATIIGVLFMGATGSSAALVLISAAVSLASQMGDIGESAIKRHAGIKDSSNLLPGHGGLLDRFDGIIGATLLVFLLSKLWGFPSVIGG